MSIFGIYGMPSTLRSRHLTLQKCARKALPINNACLNSYTGKDVNIAGQERENEMSHSKY
jgi:hypothetical protein